MIIILFENVFFFVDKFIYLFKKCLRSSTLSYFTVVCREFKKRIFSLLLFLKFSFRFSCYCEIYIDNSIKSSCYDQSLQSKGAVCKDYNLNLNLYCQASTILSILKVNANRQTIYSSILPINKGLISVTRLSCQIQVFECKDKSWFSLSSINDFFLLGWYSTHAFVLSVYWI